LFNHFGASITSAIPSIHPLMPNTVMKETAAGANLQSILSIVNTLA
jgi:hypothetical protein